MRPATRLPRHTALADSRNCRRVNFCRSTRCPVLPYFETVKFSCPKLQAVAPSQSSPSCHSCCIRPIFALTINAAATCHRIILFVIFTSTWLGLSTSFRRSAFTLKWKLYVLKFHEVSSPLLFEIRSFLSLSHYYVSL